MLLIVAHHRNRISASDAFVRCFLGAFDDDDFARCPAFGLYTVLGLNRTILATVCLSGFHSFLVPRRALLALFFCGVCTLTTLCWWKQPLYCFPYTRKKAQVDAILMKTGLNNALLPTLFIAVNNIEQYCYTRFRLKNIYIVQYS
jgi:hypothetical protein